MIVPGIAYVPGRNKYTDRDGKKFAFAIHNTSNNASDEAEAKYAQTRLDGTSAHFYTDVDSVIQSIDTDKRTGHAGSYEGNEHAISIEFTGSNAKSRAWWLENIAWDKIAHVIAYILVHDPDYKDFEIRRATVAEMKANPKVKAFYGHNDMRLAWGGTTHVDPGPSFPWDILIAKVKHHKSLLLDKGVEEDMAFDKLQEARLNAATERIQGILADEDVIEWNDVRTGEVVREPNVVKQRAVRIENMLIALMEKLNQA